MRESISESIISTVNDLNKSGLVDEVTMKNIQSLCLAGIQEYPPQKIAAVEHNTNLDNWPGL